MNKLSPEDEKAILQSTPKGTFAILVIYALVFGVAWLALYFGRFMAHGPVN
jgi:hypothetical protein